MGDLVGMHHDHVDIGILDSNVNILACFLLLLLSCLLLLYLDVQFLPIRLARLRNTVLAFP